MTNDKDILNIVTNETKKSVEQIAIVTPSIYASIFSSFASEHDLNIVDEKELAQDLMMTECSTLTNLQVQASNNAQQLSNSANKAISAIKEKDEAKLSQVLEETQTLRDEVQKLKEAVYKDALTQTLNRKWLYDNLLEKDSKKFKEAGLLTMIDLNYFKIINDTHGHIIGDKVLIFIANQLKKMKKNVIRYGGDEFIVIFPSSTTKQLATSLLNNLRDAILSKSLKAKDASFKVSFSFGISEFTKNDTLENAITKADENMYSDKQKIKKRVTGI